MQQTLRHFASFGIRSVHHLRRCPNINLTLDQYLVFVFKGACIIMFTFYVDTHCRAWNDHVVARVYVVDELVTLSAITRFNT